MTPGQNIPAQVLQASLMIENAVSTFDFDISAKKLSADAMDEQAIHVLETSACSFSLR